MNEPAFPRPPTNVGGPLMDGAVGMTLRDYFAAKAMQGMLSDMNAVGKIADKTGQLLDVMIAKAAYGQADAMLKERSK